MAVMIVTALSVLTSCGTQIPTQTKLSEAKLGPKPSKDTAVKAATGWLRGRFPLDDLSRVGFGQLEPGYYAEASGTAAQRFAWMLIGSIDAKNEYGLYEGARPYHFYFLGSELVGCAFPHSTWNGREYRNTYEVTEKNGGGLTGIQVGIRPKPIQRPTGM